MTQYNWLRVGRLTLVIAAMVFAAALGVGDDFLGSALALATWEIYKLLSE